MNPILNYVNLDQLDQVPLIISILDLDQNIVWINNAFQDATGLSPGDLDSKKCYLIWGGGKPCDECTITKTIETGNSFESEFVFKNHKHGTVQECVWQTKSQPINDRNGKIIGVIIAALDITARKHDENIIRHRNNVLQAIRRINHLVTQEKDRSQLISCSCNLLVETMGYASAWLVLLDENLRLTASAQAGLGDEYGMLLRRMREDAFNECSRRALKQPGIAFIENPRSECHDCPLIDLNPGSRTLTTRLEFNGKIFGLLSVEIPTSLIQHEAEQELFMEVACDIAFALHTIEMKADQRRVEQALKDSEEKFRTVVSAVPDLMIMLDTVGRYREIFTTDPDLLVSPADQLLGKTIHEVLPERVARLIQKAIDKTLSTGKLQQIEYDLDIEGVSRWFIGRVNRCLFQNSEYVLWSSRDITQRRKAQLTNLRLAEIIRNASDGVILTDPEGKLHYVNPAFEKMSGSTQSELMNEDPGNFIVTEDTTGIANEIRQTVKTKGEWKGELYCRRKNGEVYPIDTRVFAIRNEDGELIEIAAIQQDITERKKAEEAILESEKRFKHLVKNSNDVFVIIDKDGREIYVSDSLERITGFNPAEVLNQSWFEFLHPDDVDHIAQSFRHLVQIPGGTIKVEYRHPRKEGGWVYLEAIGSNYLNESSIQGIVLNVRDITERKLAEVEHEKLQTQLSHAQNMESVGRLAGGVAHDFNNTLGVILGYSELALNQLDPTQPLHADLQEIRLAAERSAKLTRQLLAFARRQTITPIALDLNEVVEGIILMLQRLIGEDIDLEWLPDADLWLINADPSQIDQILTNLCINARDAIEGIGKISIATGNVVFDEHSCKEQSGFEAGEYVKLSVRDNGCGMEPEILDRLFEPFFTTKEIGKGTGLGLSMVYGIVKQNKGMLNVSSEPGRGTTFSIYLPRHISRAEAIKSVAPAVPAERGHETILVVEDEIAILKMTSRLLERQGYVVLSASTPMEANRLAGDYPDQIHMLLTDVVMPQMNGRDLAKKLLSLYPNLKILYMSGYPAEVMACRGVLDEGVNFIQKPFLLGDLAAKVRHMLD